MSAPLLAKLRTGERVFATLDDFGDEPVRLLSVPVQIGGQVYAIQVGASLADTNATVRLARILFLAVSAAILGAVVLTGAMLARTVLRPIDQIVGRARMIGESALAERLPHPGTQDEMGRLVETLNDMLARIEQSFEAQRRFTADASHELRSPLSRLRTELEVTLRRPRERAEYEEALQSCLSEVERLSHLTDELLMLARLDAGGPPEAPRSVDLVSILHEAVKRLGPQALQRNVALVMDIPPELAVNVAPAALSHVVANVLDNAVKFSPLGSEVRVGVDDRGTRGRGRRDRCWSRNPPGRDTPALREVLPGECRPPDGGGRRRSGIGDLPRTRRRAGWDNLREQRPRQWSNLQDPVSAGLLISGSL